MAQDKTAEQSGKVPSTRNKKLQRDRYPLQRLKFLGDFMTQMGLTTTKAAEKAGLSQVGVYYWLKKDDAHLSSVEKLFDAFGYRLVFELADTEAPAIGTPIVSFSPAGGKRLAFLEEDILDYGVEKLADDLGLSAAGIYYWLSQDDIFISHIYSIAEKLGKRVKVSIVSK